MPSKIKITLVSLTSIAVLILIGLLIINLGRTQRLAAGRVAQNTPVPTVSLAQNTPEEVSLGDGPMPPDTMEEWIKGADIIVQAQVVRVVREGYSLGYDPQTRTQRWLNALPTPTNSGPTPTPSPYYPVTDFEIKPQTVFRDNGQIAAGKPLIFSTLGRLNSADTDQSAMPQIGQSYLFVLVQTPDKQAYGGSQACARLIVGPTTLACANRGQALLSFMKGQTPAQFIAKLQQVTAKKG